MRLIKLASGSLSAVLALLCLFLMFRPASDLRRDTSATPARDVSVSEQWSIYDPTSNHIWNRLYRSLFRRVAHDGREYGHDELDPLLWDSTKHLLGGTANREALNCLDEFLDTNADRLISDPLKRAMLQRDLWAIFDWTVRRTSTPSPAVAELQLKLTRVMRRLALTSEQVRTLPRTYDAAVAARTFAANYDPSDQKPAFLPPDLFRSDSPWVQLGVDDGSAVAPAHTSSVSGRSVFHVFIALPQGRESTAAYLRELSEFPKPWIRNRDSLAEVLPNAQLPQFPVGTRLALVRQMVVIDHQGKLITTGIVESVQIRVHRTIPLEIPQGFNTDSNVARESLDVYEFKLSRAKLFAGESGGLRAVAHDEKEFPLFQSHGIDLFEEMTVGPFERNLRPVLGSCASCHFRPGIHSVLSRIPSIVLLRVRDVRRNLMTSPDSESEDRSTVLWKQSQDSWKRLREMWQLHTAAPAG
jgi:hypothetical protein